MSVIATSHKHPANAGAPAAGSGGHALGARARGSTPRPPGPGAARAARQGRPGWRLPARPAPLTWLAAATLLLFGGSVWAQEFSLSTRTTLMHQRVTGAGSASSFLDRGSHLLHESDFRLKEPVAGGQWNSVLSGTVRVTDSPQFDPQKFSLQRLEWKLSDAHTEIHVGDHFANLSPYAMSKGIKGFALQRNLGDDQNYVRVLYGSFDGQWAYLYKDPTDEPPNRFGGGLRLQRASEQWRLGLNLAHVLDDEDDRRRIAGVESSRQTLAALDWEYRESGLVIAGEHALADTQRQVTGGTERRQEGTAHKLTVRAALGGWNLSGQFERASHDFLSLGGAATPDRLRWNLRAEYRLDRNWRLFGIYDSFRDNVGKQLPTTTRNTAWEGGLRKARFLDRRHMNLSLSWRQREIDSDDGTRNNLTHRLKLRVNDRVGQGFDWRGEAEYILDKDRRAGSDATSLLFDLGLGWRERLQSRWDVRSQVDLGRQEVEALGRTGSDVFDRVRLHLITSHDDGTVVGGFLEHSTAALVVTGADSRRSRAGLFWELQPQWLGRQGRLKFEVNDSIHRFAQDATRSYREQVAKVTLLWNHDRTTGKGR